MVYLFDKWKRIEKELGGRPLFIFLDFDGTLASIARTPEQAALLPEARAILGRLMDKPGLKLAIISGRPLEEIKDKVGLKGLIYSGNHGLEIEGPKIKFKPVVSPRYRLLLERIKNDLRQKIASIRGAFIEDKGLTLGLHYRLVDKSRVAEVKSAFDETVILYLARGMIKARAGKMLLEVLPPSEWNKGKVVLWLLARQAFAAGKGNTLPVYLGDDSTDEDAFKALQNKGLTIRVGQTKGSSAGYYVKNPGEAAEFLKRVEEL